jgi:hypothetical protein
MMNKNNVLTALLFSIAIILPEWASASDNHPPIACDQPVTAIENTPLSVVLLASDADFDALTYRIDTQPTHGALTGTAPNLVYTPANGYAGTDSFTFVANDGSADSNVGTISVFVDSPPTVIITTPPVLVFQPFIRLSASVTDSDGTLSDVAFWVDNFPSHIGPPYTLDYGYMPLGDHTLTVTATDNNGATTSASSTFYVDFQPVTSITSPADGAVVNGSSVVLTSYVGGGDGSVTVEYFNGTTKLGQSSTDPYAVTWSNLTPGSYTVSSSVTDGHGVTATSVPLTFTINAAPTVAVSAGATPAVVTGTTSALSVLGADDQGESTLTYYWTGGNTYASFAPNGTNAAKNCIATFVGTGPHTLQVIIMDAKGLYTTSSVTVTVVETLTSLWVGGTNGIEINSSEQFVASCLNQFGWSMPVTLTWSTSGGGTIDSSGLFTAGNVPGGPFTVTGSSGALSSSSSFTVFNLPPVVVTAAAANPNPLVKTNKTTLSVTATDDGGDANLTYTWSSSGPANVSFNANNGNNAKSVTATFNKTGTYTLTVAIKDVEGGTTFSSVTVTVQSLH